MENVNDNVARSKFTTDANGLGTVSLRGAWVLGQTRNASDAQKSVVRWARNKTGATLKFDTAALAGWDTSLVLHVRAIIADCGQSGVTVDRATLPTSLCKLLDLTSAVSPRSEHPSPSARGGLLGQLGTSGVRSVEATLAALGFIGETGLSTARVLARKGTLRGRDLVLLVAECGFKALPIVTLISLLTGLILAFIGAVQLKLFGAEIYVADLVGLAMVREMGALMTAIIMTGRSGAAFAATLGSMKVSEEIDALTTFGFSPFDMLVTPRVLALVSMMPLLVIYSDAVGMLGGAVIGVGMLDIPLMQYLVETTTVIDMTEIGIGLAKSIVFGAIIAMAGCYHGLRCGNNASAVGEATTSAVVTGIVLVVVADAAFAVLLNVLGL